MQATRGVFWDWQKRLENDDDLWGLRLFTPDGGLIWRNRAAVRFYEQRGFFASATTPWRGVCAWLDANELALLEHHYRESFLWKTTVEGVVTAQVPGFAASRTLTRYRAVYGTMKLGVLVTHLTPLPASDELPGESFPGLALAAAPPWPRPVPAGPDQR